MTGVQTCALPILIAKGRSLITGLPRGVEITRSMLYPVLYNEGQQIAAAVKEVIEKTPPELVGDISTNGIVMTGGGSLLDGIDRLLSQETRIPVRVAENAVECVALGTGKSFLYLDTLVDGFVSPSTKKF